MVHFLSRRIRMMCHVAEPPDEDDVKLTYLFQTKIIMLVINIVKILTFCS